MSQQSDVATVIIISALALLVLIGVAVLLLIVVHQRRVRHRAAMLELNMRHTAEVNQVEREVLGQTLTEVAGELHDNVGQLLTAVRLDINALILAGGRNEVAQGMKGTLDQAIAEIRRLSHTLNADRLRARPFAEALEEECHRLHRPGAREVVFLADTHKPAVQPDHKVVLFRIFQEAMNNALKHACATRITVMLANAGQFRMSIQDDGIGFEQAASSNGQGLHNIKRRADLIGYTCTVLSEPGKGTTVLVAQ